MMSHVWADNIILFMKMIYTEIFNYVQCQYNKRINHNLEVTQCEHKQYFILCA